ncbi:Fc.00g005120.m01.CDS01 [Cosmosporella sp. VM-42]
MSLPVSIGDVFLMSKLAWTLAQTFTTGRKSAPAEFGEVENQLYSLSAALGAIRKVGEGGVTSMPNDQAQYPLLNREAVQDGESILNKILSNCEETLKHLQHTVEKYGGIVEQTDPGRPLLKRWSREVIKNWRKIAWTTEKDLVLGIIVNSRATQIEDSLKDNSAMLKEIHLWWTNNLKNAFDGAPSNAVSSHTASVAHPLRFEVHADGSEGLQLICSRASLHENWKEGTELFSCDCNLSAPTSGSYHARLADYQLSHLSFIYRNLGAQRVWTLYRIFDKSFNRLIPITIEGVHLGQINDFEESIVKALSDSQAWKMLRGGMSNMLTQIEPDRQQGRALHILGDLKNLHKSLETVSFAIGHRTYTRSAIEGVNLLHYRALSNSSNREQFSVESGGAFCEHAEVVIFYDESEATTSADITRSVIQLRRNTLVKLNEGNAAVVVAGVRSIGYNRKNESSHIDNADITFQFTHSEVAQFFYTQLEEMRKELFVLSLQYPRRDEKVALHLQAAQVQCEDIFIPNGEIFIVRNIEDKFRLIIISRNKCTILSQVLAEDFFTSPATNGSANFRSSTYLVQLEGTGTRKIYHYQNGFKFVIFHSRQSELMFELGRNTLSRTLPIREITNSEM